MTMSFTIPSPRTLRLFVSPFFLLPILLLAGCSQSGPELAPVSGQVTLDGRPLENADLTFNVQGKSPGVARTDSDGRYEVMYKRGVMGAPVGLNKVSITVSSEVVRNPPRIPPRYNTATKLEREIIPGEDNVFDFQLTSDAK
jgi:hypothetical protein